MEPVIIQVMIAKEAVAAGIGIKSVKTMWLTMSIFMKQINVPAMADAIERNRDTKPAVEHLLIQNADFGTSACQ